jgi:hypothetical protein
MNRECGPKAATHPRIQGVRPVARPSLQPPHQQALWPQSARAEAVIDCMLNQNAHDAGAARVAAMAWRVVHIGHEHRVGIVQMPCPEVACLGLARARPIGCRAT